MSTEHHYDVIVLGGGVAGLSAAIYSARDDLRTLVVEGEVVSSTQAPGGALMLTESIENFPGYSGSGEGLVAAIRSQAETFGANLVDGLTLSADFSRDEDGYSSVRVSEYGAEPVVYFGKTIIVATGALSRQLGVPGEDAFYGHGVSTCATCDGFFYKGRVAAVVGGGDTAVEDALYLQRIASKVHVFVRGDSFRTNSPDARKLLAANGNGVEIHWNTNITEVVGRADDATKVGSVLTSHVGGDGSVELDGVFVAIGRNPNAEFLLDADVSIDDGGYIKNSEGHVLSKDGSRYPHIFAAGDVTDWRFVQAITAAGDAVKCALAAREYILSESD